METRSLKGILFPVAPLLLLLPSSAQAMHISEGILPAPWAALWFALSAPFLLWGLRELRLRSEQAAHVKPFVGLVGAAVFIISCMPIPIPATGTCSHPCGVGLAAILIGPFLTVVVTSIALVLQALFLAHGGLSTLGADIFSMGVVGAFVGYGVFHLSQRLGTGWVVAVFLAGLLSDWATYAVTALELSTALHGDGPLLGLFLPIVLAFVPTQVPLGVLEGLVCVGAYKFIRTRRPELLRTIAVGGPV